MTGKGVRVGLSPTHQDERAREFFRNTWPMYVHELSGFDTDFYTLDDRGRWQPDVADDWTAAVTPAANLREPRAPGDAGQPFQRSLVVACDGRPAGFVCLATTPFRFMPADADVILAELFVTHPHRGTGVAERAVWLLLDRWAGRWVLRVIHDNTRALRFWRRVLPRLPVERLEQSTDGADVCWRFTTRPRP